jgi:hypothetical protein
MSLATLSTLQVSIDTDIQNLQYKHKHKHTPNWVKKLTPLSKSTHCVILFSVDTTYPALLLQNLLLHIQFIYLSTALLLPLPQLSTPKNQPTTTQPTHFAKLWPTHIAFLSKLTGFQDTDIHGTSTFKHSNMIKFISFSTSLLTPITLPRLLPQLNSYYLQDFLKVL